MLVSREYEHLLLAIAATEEGPLISYLPLPHPSGVAVDRRRGVVHVASTRNPNQIFDLLPTSRLISREDIGVGHLSRTCLVPVRSRILPGSLYLHDLAMIGETLHANAVGENAVISITQAGTYERCWWPRCIDSTTGPLFGRNHLQLNSIAAGSDLSRSFFSASTDRISRRRPGHKNFAVNGRGVLFSGSSREPIARGLTRPHSARLRDGQVWLDNSGYGELGYVEDGAFRVGVRLPGWTRGLSFVGDYAFVGTSRVIPRFRQYAPGLDIDSSICAIHAVEMKSGRVVASLSWPSGNQIFAIDWVPQDFAQGLPFAGSRRRSRSWERQLFYAFTTDGRHQ